MLLVNLKTRTPRAIIENGEPKVIYDESAESAVVASTKSYKKLLRELTAQNKAPTNSTTKPIYLDREITEKTVTEMINKQLVTEKDDKKKAEQQIVANMVIEFVKGKLNGACVYAKTVENNETDENE